MYIMKNTRQSQEKEVQTSVFLSINGVVPDDQSPALIFNVYVYVWSQTFISLIMTANHGMLEIFN